MFADLKVVLVGDVDQFLSAMVDVVDLVSQVVDLLLNVDHHEGTQNAYNGTYEPFVSLDEVLLIR